MQSPPDANGRKEESQETDSGRRCLFPSLGHSGVAAGLVKPGLGVGPPALRGRLGDVEDLGSLFGGEPDEVTQLDQFGLGRVDGRELLEGFVEGEELVLSAGGGDVDVIHLDPLGSPTMALGTLASGPVHEDAPHGLGGSGEEMGAVLPVWLCIGAEAEPGFVDQGGGLEGVSGGFAGHLLGRNLT